MTTHPLHVVSIDNERYEEIEIMAKSSGLTVQQYIDDALLSYTQRRLALPEMAEQITSVRYRHEEVSKRLLRRAEELKRGS